MQRHIAYGISRCSIAVILSLLVAIIIFLSSASARVIDYNSADSLCTAFDGRPLGQAHGQTVAITCDLVRRVVAEAAKRMMVPPFRMFTAAVRREATARFEDTLADPKEGRLRNACSRDLLSLQPSYLCNLGGALVRFVLNPSGIVQRVEVSISASNPEMQATISRAAVQTGVDQFSDDGIALSMQVYAMRCRQVSDADEVYRTDGRTLYLTILNTSGF